MAAKDAWRATAFSVNQISTGTRQPQAVYAKSVRVNALNAMRIQMESSSATNGIGEV